MYAIPPSVSLNQTNKTSNERSRKKAVLDRVVYVYKLNIFDNPGPRGGHDCITPIGSVAILGNILGIRAAQALVAGAPSF
jgi:hypothetical protein